MFDPTADDELWPDEVPDDDEDDEDYGRFAVLLVHAGVRMSATWEGFDSYEDAAAADRRGCDLPDCTRHVIVARTVHGVRCKTGVHRPAVLGVGDAEPRILTALSDDELDRLASQEHEEMQDGIRAACQQQQVGGTGLLNAAAAAITFTSRGVLTALTERPRRLDGSGSVFQRSPTNAGGLRYWVAAVKVARPDGTTRIWQKYAQTREQAETKLDAMLAETQRANAVP